MFKKFLSKEGLITISNFFDPCSNVRAINTEKTIFQKEKRNHEWIQKKAQESWTLVDEEKILEPEIEEFLASLSWDSMYKEYISKYFHGMVMEDIEQGSLGNEYYIESWFKEDIEP